MKFRFTLAELSGALADLGVLLPLTLALISLNGINATAAFVGIGLAYLLTAGVYGLPIPVQPLKSLSATALALGLATPVIVAGAWWMALLFLILALSPTTRWIEKLFPQPVVRGIQLGLSFLLLQSAWGMMIKPSPGFTSGLSGSVLIALGAAAVLLVMLRLWREGAALGVVVFGISLALARGGLPPISLGLTLPIPLAELPGLKDFGAALWLLALPQLPLSLANSVYSTVDAARQYFRAESERVTPRRLLVTLSANNIVAALLGGVPVCHGCGGLTAHYRLGARSGGAPLMLGLAFVGLGVLGGPALLPVLGLIPLPVLGLLLAYVGVQHALLAKDVRGLEGWAPTLTVALTTLATRNLALGFALGAALHFGWRGSLALYRHWSLAGVSR
jgi:sulfate permease, SulP family